MAETELSSPARLPLPYPDNLPQQDGERDLEGPRLPDAGAWRRLFARTFDMWWQIPLVIFVVTVCLGLTIPSFLPWVATQRGGQIVAVLCIPLAFVLDALMLANFGRSPGKALLGLRLVTNKGEHLRLGAAIRRNLLVWVAGLAFTIPMLALVTATRQGLRVARGHDASYDAGRYRVEARPLGWWRRIGVAGALLLLALVLVMLARFGSQTDEPVSEPISPAFTWTNPETGEAVTVPPGWEYRLLTGEDDLPLHEFQRYDGRAALLFSVQPAGVSTLVDMTRDTNVLLEHVEMGSGRQESFLGSPSWAAEGFADNDAVTRLEVRVMHHDARYWRVMAAQDYPYRDSDIQVDTLRGMLWSSVKAIPLP